MGRILSGGRERDVADPKGGGADGRYRRLRIMRDITYAGDDMLAILRIGTDDRMRAHVLKQIARLAEAAGGAPGRAAADGDAANVAVDSDRPAGEPEKEDGADESDAIESGFEDRMWG